jgi:hypothetical protein
MRQRQESKVRRMIELPREYIEVSGVELCPVDLGLIDLSLVQLGRIVNKIRGTRHFRSVYNDPRWILMLTPRLLHLG